MDPRPRALRVVLIVEDSAPLRTAIASRLRRTGAEVHEAATAHGAIAYLARTPDLVLIDVCLPDGSIFDVLDASSPMNPAPLWIAMSGRATPDEAFRLAQRGVLAYLAKPFDLRELEQTLERVRHTAPEVDPLVRAAVGSVPMREMQRRVRVAMLDQALAISSGSRSGAARLLDVTRQAVQQFDRSRDPSPLSEERGDAPTPKSSSR